MSEAQIGKGFVVRLGHSASGLMLSYGMHSELRLATIPLRNDTAKYSEEKLFYRQSFGEPNHLLFVERNGVTDWLGAWKIVGDQGTAVH